MKIFRSPLFWFVSIVMVINLFVFFFITKPGLESPPSFSSDNIPEVSNQDDINDEYYWAYIKDKSNPHEKLARGNWNVSLEGDYLPEDSIHLQNLLTELNGLLGSVEFNYTQDSGKYNLDLSILKDPKMSKWAEKMNFIQSSGKKYTVENVKEVQFTFLFTDKLTQENRNSIIKFYVIHSIIEFYDKEPVIIYPKQNGFSKKPVDPKYYQFPQNDQKFLEILYAKHFYFEMFKSSPINFLAYLHQSNEERFSFSVRIFVYFIIIVYFFLAYRYKLISETFNGRKGFQKNAMSISIGFGLLNFLLHMAYMDNTGLLRFLSVILLNSLNNMLFALLMIYLIRYAEKKLIREEFNDFKKIILQVLISLFCLLLAAIIGWPNQTDEFFFFLAIITGRTIINFQKLRIKNAVTEKNLQLANLQKLQHQTELQAIQSRINPHFLYNSLNSIASLTRIHPEKAEEMALSLSDYFRYSINRNNEKMTTIKDELESVKTYLKIEKIRFSNQLEYSVRCDERLQDYLIPRFLIQPLVENAIKHGTSEMTAKGVVKIEVDLLDEKLIIKISDNGKDFIEEPIPGFGLQSIYDKLKIMYKEEANINWINKPDKAIILSLPYKPQ